MNNRLSRRLVSLVLAAALAASTTGCALTFHRNRPVFNAFEEHVVPQNETLVILTFPITFPLGLVALIVDQFVVRPFTILDDAAGDMDDLFWKDLPWDDKYVEQCFWSPWRALGTVICFPIDYGFRLFFDVESAFEEETGVPLDEAIAAAQEGTPEEQAAAKQALVDRQAATVREAATSGEVYSTIYPLAQLWTLDQDRAMIETKEFLKPGGDPIVQESIVANVASYDAEFAAAIAAECGTTLESPATEAAVRMAYLNMLRNLVASPPKDDPAPYCAALGRLAASDPVLTIRREADSASKSMSVCQ